MCQRHWSVKYRSRLPGQGTCRKIYVKEVIGRVSTSRRSTMQGLVVVGLIVEISNVDVKCVKVTGERNIGQGHYIKVPAFRTLRRSTMQGLVVVGLNSWEDIERRRNMSQSHCSVIYRSRSPGQSTCRVSTFEKHYARFGGCRPYSWGDMERWRKMFKSHRSRKNRSRSSGQGTCRVLHWGEALCKVLWL